MIQKLESMELAMLVPFFAMCLYLRKYTWHCKCKKQNLPWVQHGVKCISGRTNCCKGHTGPKWLVLTFAPMLWYNWQHHNFCCHSEAVVSIGWSLPWQNLACASGLPRVTGMKPLARQSAFWKNAWALSGSMASTDTAKTKLIHMDQGLECLPVYMWSESLKEQYPVEWSELHEINYECAVTCWSLVKTRLYKAPHIANKKLNKWPVH